MITKKILGLRAVSNTAAEMYPVKRMKLGARKHQEEKMRGTQKVRCDGLKRERAVRRP